MEASTRKEEDQPEKAPLLGNGHSSNGSSLQQATPRSSHASEGSTSEISESSNDGRQTCPRDDPSLHLESLDYEVVESLVHKEDWRSTSQAERMQYLFCKWLFVLLIGILTGSVAFFNNMAVENIVGLKYEAVHSLLQQERFSAAFGMLVFSNVGLILVASALCIYIAPEAAGSGIPEVKAYLNGVDTPQIFAPKTLFVKILGSIGSVAAGLAVGKEGPLVHTGACIANVLGQGGSRKYHLTWKWLRFFKNDRDRRDLVTCGAAAGVAAAFRAPVGGVLFALEEATSWWRSPLLWRVFFTNAVVAVSLRTLMNWCTGNNCGLFSGGGFIIFDNSQAKNNFGLLELVPVCILGLLGAFLGSLFNHLNFVLGRFRRDHVKKRGPGFKILEACAIAALTAILRFFLPIVGKCLPCPEESPVACPSIDRLSYYQLYTCPKGHYNDLAGLIFTTNDDAVRYLFSTGTFNVFSYTSLAVYFTAFYSLSILTYGITVPSGLFVPAIVCGATYGRIVGMIMATLFGTHRVDEGTYALLGAASFLGGSMRMTVSLCIILLELTGSLTMLPLIMMTLLISKTIGDSFNDAVYDSLLRLKNVPFLESKPSQGMKHLSAKDVLVTHPVSFSGIESVRSLYDALASTSHNAFPIINTDAETGLPYFHGLILRSHLLVLLKFKRNFQPTKEYSEKHSGRGYTSDDFGKPGSGKGMKVHDIVLTEEEEQMFIDLEPYANTSPHTVQEGMALDKVYTLFRQLGLRHLCVLPRASHVLGIITRKDLLRDTFEERSVGSIPSRVPSSSS